MSLDLRPRPHLFFVVLVLSATLVVLLNEALGIWAKRADRRTAEEKYRFLTSAIESMAEQCRVERWIVAEGEKLLSGRAWRGVKSDSLERLESRLRMPLPGTELLAFDRDGRLSYPSRMPGKRSRENVWRTIVGLTRGEVAADGGPGRLGKTNDLLRAMFGALVSVEDLVQARRRPQAFLNRGERWYSWILPDDRDGAGFSGIWCLIPASTLPPGRLAAFALQGKPSEVDLALVIRGAPQGPACDARIGTGRLGRGLARLFLKGHTLHRGTGGGLWMARFLPGFGSRFLVAGIRAPGLRSPFRSVRTVLILFLLVGFVVLNWMSWRWFWRADPPPVRLRYQVFLMFFVTAVLPLFSVLLFGLDRMADASTLARSTWERRMETALGQVLSEYREFTDRRVDSLRKVEARLDRAMRDGAAPEELGGLLRASLRGTPGIDVVLMDLRGFQIQHSMEMFNLNRNDEHQSLMKIYSRQILEFERRPVPPFFAEAPTLLAKKDVNLLLNKMFSSRGRFNQVLVGGVSYLQRRELVRSDVAGTPTTGFISWVIEEAVFARPFLEGIIARSQGTQVIVPGDLREPARLAERLECRSEAAEEGNPDFWGGGETRRTPRPGIRGLRALLRSGTRAMTASIASGAGDPELFREALAEDLNRLLIGVRLERILSDRTGAIAGAEDRIVARNRGVLERLLHPDLAEVPPQEPHFGKIRLGFVGQDGTVFPAGLPRSRALMRQIDKGWVAQTCETGIFPLRGGATLVMNMSNKKLGGYQLIAMIDADLLEVDSRLIAWVVLFTGLLGLVFLILAAQRLSTELIARVDGLRRFVEAIGDGRYETRTAPGRQDELGQLAVTFNDMAAGLERLERLRQFVSEKVWEKTRLDDSISLALGGERQEAAVLFSHIHGFDALVETHDSDAVIGMLNGYLALMEDAVKRNGGWIDKFIGDAVMAVFDPQPAGGESGEHPSRRATRAALEMLEASERFNRERQGRDGIMIRTDVGVQFGPVVSGNVGSRDAEGQLAHTVIGDTVNTAARIQAAAGRLPIASVVVSSEVRETLGEEFRAESLGAAALKGKSAGLELFRISKG